MSDLTLEKLILKRPLRETGKLRSPPRLRRARHGNVWSFRGATGCMDGKDLILATVTKKSGRAAGMSSAENIITTDKNEFTSLFEVDIVFPLNPNGSGGTLRSHLTYTVNLTEDNNVYVKILNVGPAFVEEAK